MSVSKKPEESKKAATAVSKAAPKSEVKTETKSVAAKTTAKKPATKTATKKTETVKKAAPEKKSTATKKTAVKSTAKKTVEKASPKKSKAVTIDVICEKLEKKVNKTKAAAIKKTIAADIEVYGFEDGSNQMMYVEIKNGKVSVAPHSYEDKNFRVSLSFANAVAFVSGKMTLAALLDSENFYAEGNIADAVKLASIF